MKWSETQVAKLEELCFKGVSNNDIAAELNCKVTDVYNKRSQLGITIDKVRAAKPIKGIKSNTEFESSLPQKAKQRGLSSDVKKAFRDLHDAVLIAMASDRASTADTKVYEELSNLIVSLESSFDALISARERCDCGAHETMSPV